MKVARDIQEKLLALQNLDASLAQLDHKIKSLPVIKILEEKSQLLAKNRDLKIAAETELSDVQHELSRCEVDVEQVVTRIEKDEKRMSSGTATPKELEQIQHELGSLARRRSELEEVELGVMVRVEEIQNRIAELVSTIATLTNEIGELQEVKSREVSTMEDARSQNQSDRIALSALIEPELLALYEKIRVASDGVGAALLKGSQCEGCHLDMNAAEIARIRALSDDEVVRCEECRRILIRVG